MQNTISNNDRITVTGTGDCSNLIGTATTNTVYFNEPYYNTVPASTGYLYWDNNVGWSTNINDYKEMNTNETKEAFEIMLLAPGVELEDVDVYVRNGELRVELDMDKEVPCYEKLAKEFSTRIDDKIYDINGIEATLQLGVLMIHIPKQNPDIVVKVK